MSAFELSMFAGLTVFAGVAWFQLRAQRRLIELLALDAKYMAEDIEQMQTVISVRCKP